MFAFESAPADARHRPPHRSLLNNSLGEGADAIVSSAFEMPQIMTLCGIQPEQTDIDFSYRRLDAADAKLLAFDLSKNRTVKTVKYAATPERSLLCQPPADTPDF